MVSNLSPELADNVCDGKDGHSSVFKIINVFFTLPFLLLRLENSLSGPEATTGSCAEQCACAAVRPGSPFSSLRFPRKTLRNMK